MNFDTITPSYCTNILWKTFGVATAASGLATLIAGIAAQRFGATASGASFFVAGAFLGYTTVVLGLITGVSVIMHVITKIFEETFDKFD